MKTILPFVIAAFSAGFAGAQTAVETPQPQIIQPGEAADLNEFLWIKRPVVVFADSPADPRFVQQMDLLNARLDDLETRDVVVLTDTTPAAKGALRQKLRPRGFVLVLIAKDGTVILRKPSPWDVRELSRAIDKLPLRQQEVRDRRASAASAQ